MYRQDESIDQEKLPKIAKVAPKERPGQRLLRQAGRPRVSLKRKSGKERKAAPLMEKFRNPRGNVCSPQPTHPHLPSRRSVPVQLFRDVLQAREIAGKKDS